MLAPHLNPAIDAHLRFRLKLQVSNVRQLVDSPKNVWMTAYSLAEVRRYRRVYPYGWQVCGTTLDNLFRKYKIPWSDEDEEKVAEQVEAEGSDDDLHLGGGDGEVQLAEEPAKSQEESGTARSLAEAKALDAEGSNAKEHGRRQAKYV